MVFKIPKKGNNIVEREKLDKILEDGNLSNSLTSFLERMNYSKDPRAIIFLYKTIEKTNKRLNPTKHYSLEFLDVLENLSKIDWIFSDNKREENLIYNIKLMKEIVKVFRRACRSKVSNLAFVVDGLGYLKDDGFGKKRILSLIRKRIEIIRKGSGVVPSNFYFTFNTMFSEYQKNEKWKILIKAHDVISKIGAWNIEFGEEAETMLSVIKYLKSSIKKVKGGIWTKPKQLDYYLDLLSKEYNINRFDLLYHSYLFTQNIPFNPFETYEKTRVALLTFISFKQTLKISKEFNIYAYK